MKITFWNVFKLIAYAWLSLLGLALAAIFAGGLLGLVIAIMQL